MTKTEVDILCEQVASTEKVSVANLNITEVFWGPVGYVKSEKPSDNQLTNLDNV